MANKTTSNIKPSDIVFYFSIGGSWIVEPAHQNKSQLGKNLQKYRNKTPKPTTILKSNQKLNSYIVEIAKGGGFYLQWRPSITGKSNVYLLHQ